MDTEYNNKLFKFSKFINEQSLKNKMGIKNDKNIDDIFCYLKKLDKKDLENFISSL